MHDSQLDCLGRNCRCYVRKDAACAGVTTAAVLLHEDLIGVHVRERERDRDIHHVHSASLAYEDFCSKAMRQWQTDFWSLCHMNIRMHPTASWNRPENWALMSLK